MTSSPYFPEGTPMTIAGGYPEIEQESTKWIGTDGWVFAGESGIECSNPKYTGYKNLPDELRKVKLYESPGHVRNFLDCVKSRAKPVANAEVMRRSHTVCHAAAIAWILKRKLSFDPVKEAFVNDDEANGLRSRPARDPWQV